MNYKDYSDSQLLNLIHEENEEAKDILFDKYQYIIKITIKKYITTAKILNIEYTDLYQEALLGYSDAIKSYKESYSSLPTFITLCVDRRLQVAIRKASTIKNKVLNSSISLEYTYSEERPPLMDVLSDDNKNDPLYNLQIDEEYFDLLESIRSSLSESEYEVFSLMVKQYTYTEIAQILKKNPKQIDNAIQRIKQKIKKIISNR